MNLVVEFDQAISSLPSGFVSAVDYVVGYFDSLFTNNATITIDVGYGEIDGQRLESDALGESEQANVTSVSYSAVRNALIAEGAPGVSTLPATSPAPGGDTLYMPTSEQKALGLIPNNSEVDGYVGFDSGSNIFSYSIGTAPPSGEYYFVGVVEHEFTEVMGRTSYLDYSGAYSLMDLFRYAAPGDRQFTTGASSYFSINSGTTDLDNWNNYQTGNDGDLGDWAPSAGDDAFDDNSNPGVVNAFSSTDLTLMNAIGWTTGSQPAPSPAQASATSLRPIGTGDFGGIGADSAMLWQSSSGTPTFWLMNGATAAVVTTVTPPLDWQIVGIGDFNNDGQADILWQDADGDPGIWFMNGTSVGDAVALVDPPIGWRVIGAGDFFDTGYDDTILWQNQNGDPALWLMNDATIVDAVALPNPGPSWQVIDAGDFFDAGHDNSILLQNSNGTPMIWEMQGGTVLQEVTLPDPPSSWQQIVGVGDFFGTGRNDTIVWQNTNGEIGLWEMDGATMANSVAIGNPGSGWEAVGIGAFYGGTQSDILFENSSTGAAEIWQMNGNQIVATNSVATGTENTTLADTVVGFGDISGYPSFGEPAPSSTASAGSPVQPPTQSGSSTPLLPNQPLTTAYAPSTLIGAA